MFGGGDMRGDKRFILAAMVIVLFSLSAVMFAQQAWETKDFHKWSAKEAESLLNQGPWTATRSISQVTLQSARSTGSNNDAQGRDTSIEIVYTVQFYSAK